MAQITTTRGEEFVRILIREYESLLADAKAAIIRHKRLQADYSYTPSQIEEQNERASLYYKDVEHYTNVLAQLKGAENGESIPTVEETESPNPQIQVYIFTAEDVCILGL